MPDALLRALDVTIGRRVEGMLAGDYRSALLGAGTELAQVRPYEPGDDVRRIDWNVTARTGEPHVRVHLAERVLVTWLVLDTSPSMQFGTADRRKADVAEGVALAVGHVATRRGNRLGVVTFGGADRGHEPPRQGRGGLIGLLRALRADEPTPRRAARRRSARRSGARARSRGSARSWSSSPTSAARSTGAGRCSQLAGRHDVIAVEIRDPREEELPNVGELWLVDPETGRPAARRHARRQAARPLRRGRRRGAQRSRADARGARRAPRRRSRRRATGCARSRCSCAEGAAVTFEWPLALLALLVVPVLVVALRRRERRRGDFAKRFANPALLPNLVAAPPGAGATFRWRVLLALSTMLVGVARPHAMVSVPREEATIVLAIDVSSSMTAKDVPPTRLVAARRAARAFVARRAGEVPRRPRVVRGPRDRRSCRRPSTAALVERGARRAEARRRHGARRRDRALRRLARRAGQRSDRPPPPRRSSWCPTARRRRPRAGAGRRACVPAR